MPLFPCKDFTLPLRLNPTCLINEDKHHEMLCFFFCWFFSLNLRRFLTFWNLQMMSIWVQVFISKPCHNKKWKEVKKQFQFADSLDSFSASLCNWDLQFLSNLKEKKNIFFLLLMCLRMHIFSLKYLATIHDYLFSVSYAPCTRSIYPVHKHKFPVRLYTWQDRKKDV